MALHFFVFLAGATCLPLREQPSQPQLGAGGSSSARVRLPVSMGMLYLEGEGCGSSIDMVSIRERGIVLQSVAD